MKFKTLKHTHIKPINLKIKTRTIGLKFLSLRIFLVKLLVFIIKKLLVTNIIIKYKIKEKQDA